MGEEVLAQGGKCTKNSTELSVVPLSLYEHMGVRWESQPVHQGMAVSMVHFPGLALHHSQPWEGHRVRSSQLPAFLSPGNNAFVLCFSKLSL